LIPYNGPAAWPISGEPSSVRKLATVVLLLAEVVDRLVR
jgi:hypothetical protein